MKKASSENKAEEYVYGVPPWGAGEDSDDTMFYEDQPHYDSALVSRLIRDDEYQEAIRVIRKFLRKHPKSHWLMACLSCCYYEQYRYDLAVRWAWRAVDITPECPLSMWYYATALDMWGRRQAKEEKSIKWALDVALIVFRQMLKFGLRYMATVDPCGEGYSKAGSILNDARYRMALIHWHRKEYKDAVKWAKLHLRKRVAGQKSIYTKKQVEKDLKAMQDEKLQAVGG
jgi:hypothetical protein